MTFVDSLVSTDTTDELIEAYGPRFEQMTKQWKLLFRASLATYLAIRPIWIEEGSSVTCIEACIAGAGGDDLNIWDEEPQLIDFINKVCELSDIQIEGLIEAMTAQLREGVYQQ
jgi:hypothetical protein